MGKSTSILRYFDHCRNTNRTALVLTNAWAGVVGRFFCSRLKLLWLAGDERDYKLRTIWDWACCCSAAVTLRCGSRWVLLLSDTPIPRQLWQFSIDGLLEPPASLRWFNIGSSSPKSDIFAEWRTDNPKFHPSRFVHIFVNDSKVGVFKYISSIRPHSKSSSSEQIFPSILGKFT